MARAVWLQLKAQDIKDSKLRQIFLAELDSAAAEMQQHVPDFTKIRPIYFTMAVMFEEGQRDPSGLPYGPGCFILERYLKHVESIARPFKITQLKLSDQEKLAIMLLGDSVCWSMNGELGAVLQEMLAAP